MSTHYLHTDIARRLQLRAPLLMLDQAWLTIADEGGASPRACGIKQLSINEALFAGHFPGYPILPGVLQIAAMAQLAELLCQELYGYGQRFFLSALKRIKFRKPVFPGSTMLVKAELQSQPTSGSMPSSSLDFKVSCLVDGATVSCGSLTLAPYPTEAATPALPESVPAADGTDGAPLSDGTALTKLLPHRPPFLLLDGAYGLGGDSRKLRGYKNVTAGDSLLAASGSACYPPFLMLESAAQLGCASMLSQPGNAGLLGIFMGIDEAHFTRPLLPGERLEITGTCESVGQAGIGDIAFHCGGHPVGSCQLKFVLSPAASNS